MVSMSRTWREIELTVGTELATEGALGACDQFQHMDWNMEGVIRS